MDISSSKTNIADFELFNLGNSFGRDKNNFDNEWAYITLERLLKEKMRDIKQIEISKRGTITPEKECISGELLATQKREISRREKMLKNKENELINREQLLKKYTESKNDSVVNLSIEPILEPKTDINGKFKMINLKEIFDKYNEFIRVYKKYQDDVINIYKKLANIFTNIPIINSSSIQPIELDNYDFPATLQTMSYINNIRQNIDAIMDKYKKISTHDPSKKIPKEYLNLKFIM